MASMELAVISLASLLAGFLDSIVGGGGLVLVPAMFATFPSSHPATLLGTNKGAAIWGTGMAAWQYSRRVELRWNVLMPAAALGFTGSMAGAWVPFILLAMLLYTLAKKQMGQVHAPRFTGRSEVLAAGFIGLTLGFYDGFFGPGTGSLFVFLMVRWLGYDFLNASASAKVMNCATNLAALILFTAKGHVWWHFVAVMAVANVAGSLLGTHLALKHGAGFIRAVFVLVVGALILKTGYDAFLRV